MEAVDSHLALLRQGASSWPRLSVEARCELLEEVAHGVAETAEEWVALACEHKGLPAESPLAGEEWISGPWALLTYLNALRGTLDALSHGRDPAARLRTRRLPSGQLAVRVVPYDNYDRLLLHGYHAEVWLARGTTASEMRERIGRPLLEPDGGGVCAVLGAGNISSIAPLDALHKLCVANRTVLVKLNPVNDYLGPILERAFRPLTGPGYVRFAYGGADVGEALVTSPEVDEVHVTGSAATLDAILFGSGEAGDRRKAAGRPRLDKAVSSELGGVSPVIVVGGEWSDADLRFQAEHVATQKLHNGGFNCIAAQVVVLPSAWRQKDAFLGHLSAALRSPPRPSYYPGAEERIAAALRDDRAQALDDARRTLIHVDSEGAGESAFDQEYFAPVLAVAEIRGDSVDAYLDRAAGFCDERLAGSLGAGLIVDPRTRRRHRSGLQNACERLRYGAIGINAWTAVAYLSPRVPWGGFGFDRSDRAFSGLGTVHNALLLADTERTVVEAPFRPLPRSLLHGELALAPKPPWFVGNRTAATTGRRLTHFAARPSWRRLAPIFASALRG